MPRTALLLAMATIATFAAIVSFASSFASRKLAHRVKALDIPGGRHKHSKVTPLLGGLGIVFALFLSTYIAWNMGWLQDGILHPQQMMGFLGGLGILLIGGLIDDIRPLPPKVQIIFPVLASLLVIASGTGIIQVTNPFKAGGFNLQWWTFSGISFPADLLTFFWLMLATYATKLQDGLDGLVTGLAVIGSVLVGALSSSIAYYQPAVAILTSIVSGSFFGFLPVNAPPAKQFLGEIGSTVAGFTLGVLAILSSAKVAIALCVLAIPIADGVLVAFGRIRRGVPWHVGDRSHLHFRLVAAGLSPRYAVILLWGISATTGILAFGFQTRGKVLLVVSLVLFTIFASSISAVLAKRKGIQEI